MFMRLTNTWLAKSQFFSIYFQIIGKLEGLFCGFSILSGLKKIFLSHLNFKTKYLKRGFALGKV